MLTGSLLIPAIATVKMAAVVKTMRCGCSCDGDDAADGNDCRADAGDVRGYEDDGVADSMP